MKNLTPIRFCFLLITGALFLIATGCKKDDTTVTPVTDIDGNVYHTITIGNQVWMVENLKTTRYNDGTAITLISDSAVWVNLVYTGTPGYCWYKNDAVKYKSTYGAIYNWYAVNTGKLAPAGWRIPTDADWTTLATFLGGDSLAGNKLKEQGTYHWAPLNIGADNSSGFSALPGGVRLYDASFNGISQVGYWWSVTASDSGSAWTRELNCSNSKMNRENYGKTLGCYVRCIKN